MKMFEKGTYETDLVRDTFFLAKVFVESLRQTYLFVP
jgi:hypothetical protein